MEDHSFGTWYIYLMNNICLSSFGNCGSTKDNSFAIAPFKWKQGKLLLALFRGVKSFKMFILQNSTSYITVLKSKRYTGFCIASYGKHSLQLFCILCSLFILLALIFQMSFNRATQHWTLMFPVSNSALRIGHNLRNIRFNIWKI